MQKYLPYKQKQKKKYHKSIVGTVLRREKSKYNSGWEGKEKEKERENL